MVVSASSSMSDKSRMDMRPRSRLYASITADRRCSARPFHSPPRETRIAALIGLVVCLVALAADERIGSVRDLYDGNLPLSVEVNTFRHIDQVFPSAVVRHGGRAFPLPPAATPLRDVSFAAGGQQLHLADYLRLNRVAGLLVLKNGRIALERYEFGNTPATRWVSFSLSNPSHPRSPPQPSNTG